MKIKILSLKASKLLKSKTAPIGLRTKWCAASKNITRLHEEMPKNGLYVQECDATNDAKRTNVRIPKKHLHTNTLPIQRHFEGGVLTILTTLVEKSPWSLERGKRYLLVQVFDHGDTATQGFTADYWTTKARSTPRGTKTLCSLETFVSWWFKTKSLCFASVVKCLRGSDEPQFLSFDFWLFT